MKFNFNYFLDTFMLLDGVDMCSFLETGKIPSNIVGAGVCHVSIIRCISLIKHLITYEMFAILQVGDEVKFCVGFLKYS